MSSEKDIRVYLEGKCTAVRNFRGWDYARIMKHGDFLPADCVLDTGAYHTYFSVYLAPFVERVIATDNYYWAERDYIEEQALPSPEEWKQEIRALGEGKISAEYADVREMPYEDASFDKVLSISTIEHVQDDVQAMHEMIRVLKPGGALLLTTELGLASKIYSEEDGSYYRIYDPTRLFWLLTCVPNTELEYLESAPGCTTDEVTGKEFTTVFAIVRKWEEEHV